MGLEIISTDEYLRPRATFYREGLLKATFDPNRALAPNIDRIYLGPFGDESTLLYRHFVNDPLKREHAAIVYVTANERVIMSEKPLVGEPHELSVPLRLLVKNGLFYLVPKKERQNKFLGAIIHSHSVDVPPSPADLGDLLLNDFTPSANTSAFVITPKRRFIIFRGKDSPNLSKDETESKKDLWNGQLEERIVAHLPFAKSRQEEMDINNRAQMAMLKQIAFKYDLRVFIGESDANHVRLAYP